LPSDDVIQEILDEVPDVNSTTQLNIQEFLLMLDFYLKRIDKEFVRNNQSGKILFIL
jgi:hypothetical protein